MDVSKIITISDKSTAPQLSSTSSPLDQFLTEMRAYFVSNVMTTAWSVLLFAGGMIFLIYFFSIRFMPELNPQASITLLATSILTAGFLLLAMIMSLFAPVVFWKTWMFNSSYKRLQDLWYQGEKFIIAYFILWIGLPFAVIVGGIFFLDSTIVKQWGLSIELRLASLAIIASILPFLFLPLWKKLSDDPPGVLGWRAIRDLLWGYFLFLIGIIISFYVL